MGDFPVVLDEANVVLERVRPERAQRLEVLRLDVNGRRLEDHLVLVKLLQAIGVVSVATVGGASRGLDERNIPRSGPSARKKVAGLNVPAPTSELYG